MQPFIKELLRELDVHGSHGAAITLDDFGEGELRQRYHHLFQHPTHDVFVLDDNFHVHKVTNWTEFMAVVKRSPVDISSVVAVPRELGSKIEKALAEAA